VSAIKVALVGAGAVVDMYLDKGLLSLRDRGEVEFVAAFSRRRERAEALAARLGSEACTDWQALLGDPRIEAFIIATPHAAHAPLTLAALAAGKHVLVEKPLATNLADARAMVEAAERAGKVLSVFENMHYVAPFAITRRLIAEGAIGPLVMLRAHRLVYLEEKWLREDWRAKGEAAGIIVDQVCHFAHTLRQMAGSEIVRVHALARRTRPDFAAEDLVLLNVQFASGLVGQISLGWSTRTSFEPEVNAYGAAGSIDAWRWPDGRVVLRRSDLPAGEKVVAEQADFFCHVETFADFFAAVRGERPSEVSGREGFADLAVADAARRSVASGQTEDVAPFTTSPGSDRG
jgi:predicted dehydrogenase